MSLGVDERSPSAAEASEMTEGWREWQGLILTTAGGGTHTHIHAHTHAKKTQKKTHTQNNPRVSVRNLKETPLLVC